MRHAFCWLAERRRMRLYARERCADPRAYYDTVEDVMSDDDLTADEKEYILKSMAVDAELHALRILALGLAAEIVNHTGTRDDTAGQPI